MKPEAKQETKITSKGPNKINKEDVKKLVDDKKNATIHKKEKTTLQ